MQKFGVATDKAIANGYLLAADRDAILAQAAKNYAQAQKSKT